MMHVTNSLQILKFASSKFVTLKHVAFCFSSSLILIKIWNCSMLRALPFFCHHWDAFFHIHIQWEFDKIFGTLWKPDSLVNIVLSCIIFHTVLLKLITNQSIWLASSVFFRLMYSNNSLVGRSSYSWLCTVCYCVLAEPQDKIFTSCKIANMFNRFPNLISKNVSDRFINPINHQSILWRGSGDVEFSPFPLH